MSVAQRLRGLERRLYERTLDPAARAQPAATAGVSTGFERALAHTRYCLLTSYRRDGRPVSTPVWFALEDGSLYLRTEAHAGKVKRVRRNPDVLVVPCTARGRPLGPPVEGLAHVLEPEESLVAERALRARYGVARQLYKLIAPRGERAYIAVRPRDAPGG